MPVKLPTDSAETSPVEPVEEKSAEQPKFDPFHPEMPQIPGVNQTPVRRGLFSNAETKQKMMLVGGGAAAVLVILALFISLGRSKPRPAPAPTSETDAADQAAASAAAVPKPAEPSQVPAAAATLDELSKPWAAKQFTFVKPITGENIPAMVVRLPAGALWAFSLQGPDGRCNLEYVSDLAALDSKYGYRATHPMVVSPCDKTVYDPLKIGSLGGNTWVRGEIVQGMSLRPPISIDVRVHGRSIIADSIE
jgi:hypothetical protein